MKELFKIVAAKAWEFYRQSVSNDSNVSSMRLTMFASILMAAALSFWACFDYLIYRHESTISNFLPLIGLWLGIGVGGQLGNKQIESKIAVALGQKPGEPQPPKEPSPDSSKDEEQEEKKAA